MRAFCVLYKIGGNMEQAFSIVFESLLLAVGFLMFYLFRVLVSEVANLRREIQSLNEKIAEILASYRVFELRLSYLEKEKIHGKEQK